jgi:hypothetical protein
MLGLSWTHTPTREDVSSFFSSFFSFSHHSTVLLAANSNCTTIDRFPCRQNSLFPLRNHFRTPFFITLSPQVKMSSRSHQETARSAQRTSDTRRKVTKNKSSDLEEIARSALRTCDANHKVTKKERGSAPAIPKGFRQARMWTEQELQKMEFDK